MARSLRLGIVACCFLFCSASRIARSNAYLDSLLRVQGPWTRKDFFDVPGFLVHGEAEEGFRVSFVDGMLSNSGSFRRRGNCEGPAELAESAYIKCSVLFSGFEAGYPFGELYRVGGREIARAEADILPSVAKVQFHHFKGNMTEQVRVTVDEVGIRLRRLEPDLRELRQSMFRGAVELEMNRRLSDAIPELLADRLILAMDSVKFPLP